MRINETKVATLALIVLMLPLQAAYAGTLAQPQMADTRAGAKEGQMTEAERQYLDSELRTTESAFLASIKGLTPAQWTFKAAPDRWSIQECAEHIILAEPLLVADAKRMLTTPAVPRLATANPEGDREQLRKVLDRRTKTKAPAPLVPSGQFATPEQAATEFNKRRNATIDYVDNTNDPLRSHTGAGPAGETNDAYQVLLLLGGHSGRHTAQILEVKASPGYPAGS